jgi:tetratricopeptide (TPR) repeat protein
MCQIRMITLVVLVSAAWTAGSTFLLAQSQDWNDCQNSDNSDIRIAACSKLIDSTSTNRSTRVRAYINRGDQFRELQDLDHAIADYGAALQLDPTNTSVLENRADIYLDRGDLDRALADYTRLTQLKPREVTGFLGRGNVYTQKGDFKKALVEYDTALRIKPGDSDAPEQKRTLMAIETNYHSCVDPAKFNVNPIVTAGVCTLHLNRRIQNRAQNAKVLTKRATAFRSQGDLSRAFIDLDEAIRLDPSSADAFLERADTHFEEGAFQKAIDDYTVSVQAQSDPILKNYSRLWRALAYGLQGQLEHAITELNQFDQKDPFGDLARGWFLGFAYLRMGDARRAIGAFTEYLNKITDPSILTERGIIYLNQGDIDLAITNFDAALSYTRPRVSQSFFDDFTFAQSDALLHRAAAYERRGDLGRAAIDREESKRRGPKVADAYTLRIMVKLAKGDYKAAVDDADEAGRLFPTYSHWSHRFARLMATRELGEVPKPVVVARTGPTEIKVPIDKNVAAALTGNSDVTINGQKYGIKDIDSNADTVTLLGDTSILRSGLNLIEAGVRRFTFWNEELKLQAFDEPYKKSYAILVAIDDYERTKDPEKRGPITGLRPLKGMVQAAEALRSTLIQVGFPSANIFPFYDEKATVSNLNNALGEFWKGGKYETADRLFFYFGGHGDGVGGNGYLVTYDFDSKRPTFTGFLMADFVGRHFPNIQTKHMLVALDACSSGLAVPNFMSGAVDSERLKQFTKLTNIKADLREKARNLVVAGTGDEPAVANVQSGGIFTNALIDGLRGDADYTRDGIVQLEELAIYLERTVRARAAALGMTQDPDVFRGTQFGRGKIMFVLPNLN